MAAINLTRALSSLLLLACIAIRLQAASGAGNEWTTPAGILEGTRFSTLAQITDQNVAGLVEENSFSTRSNSYMEGQPLVVNNTMYILGPFPNRLFALDLTQREDAMGV